MVGEDVSDEELRDILHELDEDCDGYISKREFVNFLCN
jgi:Ca2+-binding EF-hand superfamily protein